MIPRRFLRLAFNEIGTLHNFLHRRIFANPKLEASRIDEFHRLYYDSYVWNDTRWMGVPIMKCPLDLFMYQEMLFELKPNFVIETGTAYGGSAFYMAHCMDLVGTGRVLSIDIEHQDYLPQHPRIEYLKGSSTADNTLAAVEQRIKPGERIIIILDSDHSKDHVARELKLYAPMVSLGSYLVVEDTNVNGHPVYPAFGPGPMEAVEDFVRVHPEFVVDRSREKFYMTFNPSGYLKRVV